VVDLQQHRPQARDLARRRGVLARPWRAIPAILELRVTAELEIPLRGIVRPLRLHFLEIQERRPEALVRPWLETAVAGLLRRQRVQRV
jgi:hypothetical protein